ncbi:MAG: hypothetical protein Q9172_003017 [Xanthocarpia lactea]
MFDLFTPSKPRTAHTRSQSSPYLPAASNNPLATNNHHGYNHSTSHQDTVPQSPALTHPPAYISPSTSDLPLLATQDLPPTRPIRSTSKLSDWFTGESEPFTFAIVPSPTKVKLDLVDEMNPSLTERTISAMEKQPVARNCPKPPFISRFSLFGSKQLSTEAPKTPTNVHDKWYDLDVKTALPQSPPTDTFSPSAFKDLQQNAEGLLSQLQAAYRQRSQALHDVLAEKEAQAEEHEGTAMRSRHLKLQLDDMTAKLVEQDKAMMDLVDQLAQEKMARRQAEDAMRMAQANFVNDGRHTRRSSKSRTSTASEMSIQSEGSCVESLFSSRGAASPTMSMSSVSTMNSPESQTLHHQSLASTDRCRRQTTHANAESRCQGTQTTTSNGTFTSFPPIPSSPCVNCNDLKDSEPSHLVNILKLENRILKTRLGQLESTVNDCLDMVNGLF